MTSKAAGVVQFQLSSPSPSSNSPILKIQKGDITKWYVDGSSDAINGLGNEEGLLTPLEIKEGTRGQFTWCIEGTTDGFIRYPSHAEKEKARRNEEDDVQWRRLEGNNFDYENEEGKELKHLNVVFPSFTEGDDARSWV